MSKVKAMKKVASLIENRKIKKIRKVLIQVKSNLSRRARIRKTMRRRGKVFIELVNVKANQINKTWGILELIWATKHKLIKL